MVSKKAKQKATRPGGGRVSAVAKLSGTRREPVPPKRGLSVRATDDDAPQLPPKPDTTRGGGGERAPLPPKRGLGVGRIGRKPNGSRGVTGGPALQQLPPKPDGTRGGLAPQLPPKPAVGRGDVRLPLPPKYGRGCFSAPLPPKPDGSLSVPLPPKPDGSLSVGSRGSAH